MQSSLPWWLVVAAVAAFFIHQFVTTKRDRRAVLYFWLFFGLTICVQVYLALVKRGYFSP